MGSDPATLAGCSTSVFYGSNRLKRFTGPYVFSSIDANRNSSSSVEPSRGMSSARPCG
jgi:hypothetical protein